MGIYKKTPISINDAILIKGKFVHSDERFKKNENVPPAWVE